MVKEEIIFWDWNGTLLNDARVCLQVMNTMMSQRKMPSMNMQKYREVFGFPVKDYYRRIGFDFQYESFEDLSVQFIDLYHSSLPGTGLVEGAERVLQYFHGQGKENIIVSAMQQEMLEDSVKLNGVEPYFDGILGIRDIYASGKLEVAQKFVSEKNIDPSNAVFIGDTTHDYEVARGIGCRCILVADGHQSRERLEDTGARVIGTLEELLAPIVPKSF